MARINIEDSLYKDDRFLELVLKTGNVYIAKGMMLTAFTLAQKYWLSHRSIPESAWPKSLNILIECNLATFDSNGGSIYVRGSSENFAWLDRSSKAGKSKSKNKTKHLRNQINTKIQIENNEVSLEPQSNQTEPLTLTLTHSHSLNSYSSSNSSGTVLEKSKPGPVDFEDENALILSIDKKILDNWGRLYEQEYLQRELLKAWNWYANNPRKKPKSMRGWVQALSSWFDRGWKYYVKNIETQKPDEFSFLRKDENEPTNF